MRRVLKLAVAVWTIFLASSLAASLPAHPFEDYDLSFVKRQGRGPLSLRILSLGASIMHGYGSSLPDGSLGNG